MANPNWKKGMASANPAGRRKQSFKSKSVAAILERFVYRNLSGRKMQVLYDKLKAPDKLRFLIEVMPYITPRKAQVSLKGQLTTLSESDLSELYERITGSNTDDILSEIIGETKQLPEPQINYSGTYQAG
jgi:hypothetical protein